MTAINHDAVGLWASAQVTALKVKKWPVYGSLAWRVLKAEDPRRAAAILEAAELWRRSRADQAWLDQLLIDSPEHWFRVVTEEANNQARKIAAAIRNRPTAAEMSTRRQHRPAREVTATSGWPPIAIPGRPGWHRHCIGGEQIDLARDSTTEKVK